MKLKFRLHETKVSSSRYFSFMQSIQEFLPDDTEQSAIYTSLHGLLNLANTG